MKKSKNDNGFFWIREGKLKMGNWYGLLHMQLSRWHVHVHQTVSPMSANILIWPLVLWKLTQQTLNDRHFEMCEDVF